MNVAYSNVRGGTGDCEQSSALVDPGISSGNRYDVDELISDVGPVALRPHDSASSLPSLGRPLHETSEFLDRLGVVVHL